MNHSDFIHLKVHTSYSLAESAIKINDLVDLCVKQKMPAIAITDTINLFGAFQFSIKAKEKGIQPIIGCKINVAIPKDDPRNNKFIGNKELDCLVFLAKNEIGYTNLMKLSTKAFLIGKNESCDPHIKFSDLYSHNEGLICLTGSRQGGIGKLLDSSSKDFAKNYLFNLRKIYSNRLYIEISRQGFSIENKMEEELLNLAFDNKVPIVATNETYFIDENMFEAHDTLLCITSGSYLSQSDRRHSNINYKFKTSSQMKQLFSDIPEAIENTVVISKRCAFMIEKRKPVLPPYNKAYRQEDESRELSLQSLSGLKKRLKVVKDEELPEAYYKRLIYELDIINKMGYSGYFLIVSDFIKWAKNNKIPVGPGRGSGAGSLVAWSLTITDVDPICFGLIFERFLNPERVSMPDFDIDFCQERRDEVINYVCEKYGRNHVAQIITFGKLQARAVIRDVGRVLQIPYGVVDNLCKMVPYNPAHPISLSKAVLQEDEIKNEKAKNPGIAKLLEIAINLEGLYRHASTHAAGIVISELPLESIVPLYYDNKSDMSITQFDMKDVEQFGLVKFDFLGLKTLTVISKTIDLLREDGIDINISDIPLDDETTFQMLKKVETVGVFQLESSGMSDVVRRLKPSKFDELVALVALYRPGPMDDIPRYIACKHGKEKVNYLHPSFKEILEETFGVMVYQEQVIKIAQVFAGYTLGDADILRRAMGKKIKSEMDSQRKIFIEGAKQKNKIKENFASQIFDQIAKFAGYGFNKSHAAPYALLSYQTAYLKANYTPQFMAALMSLEMNNTDKLNIFRQELKLQDIDLLPPDINVSEVSFIVEKNEEKTNIRYALSAIKNVGESAMQKVIAERNKGGPYDNIINFVQRLDSRVINKRMLENLIKSGAFDSLHNNRNQLHQSIDVILKHSGSLVLEKKNAQKTLFNRSEMEKSLSKSITFPNVKSWSFLDKLQGEFDSIGFYLTAHPLDSYVDIIAKYFMKSNELIEYFKNNEGNVVSVASVVLSKTVKVGRNGQKYAFVQFSDPFGTFEVALFSEQLLQYREFIESGKALVLKLGGRIDNERKKLMLTIYSIELMEHYLKNKLLILEIELNNENALHKLKKVLQEKGNMQVSLVLYNSEHNKINLKLPGMYNVSSEIQCDIKNIDGIKSVRYA